MDLWTLAISLFVLTVGVVVYIETSCAREITLIQRLLMFYILEITFLPLVLLPLELEITEPENDMSASLSSLWLTYYYLNFINGYFVLPLTIGYYVSGHFTAKKRFLNALWVNVSFYLITILLGLLAFAFAHHQYGVQFSEVQVFVPKIVNTICFFVYCALLSYGVFQLPFNYLRNNFFLKIHHNLIVFKETTDDYYQLISTLIQLQEAG